MSVQLLTLIVFIYYIFQYAQRFGKQKDSLTIACFIFVVLTFSCKLLCRTISMLAMRFNGYSFSSYTEHVKDVELDPWMCVYNMSG